MAPDTRDCGRLLPYAPSAIGAGILLVILGEWVVFAGLRLDAILGPLNVASLAISLPVVVGLLYAGFWLDRSGVAPERYGRVAGWCLGGLAVFVLLNLPSMLVSTLDDRWVMVGWLRWAAAIGTGIGFVTGVIEARAIDREIAAERASVRNRELRRQNDRLEEFASVIAHDLRNPLNVAAGRLDLARGEDESLAAAARALERMEQIIERTLTLARSGLVVDEPEPVDLAELALDSWGNAATGDAELRLEAAPVVSADPDRLRHVFENLFRNAAEHAGPAPTVRVGALEDGFYVEDDGPGIRADKRTAVFEAGYSSISDGTGFGLSIVRQIADAHGWTVTVAEGETGGARFEFTGVEDATEADSAAGRKTPAR